MPVIESITTEWLEAFHIIFMVSWFAGLFYLPRIFVYHAGYKDGPVHEQFCVMESKLYKYIMMPAMILTVAMGMLLAVQEWDYVSGEIWFWIKMTLVTLLLTYHFYSGHLAKVFAAGKNSRDHKFYRFYNEAPTLILIAVVILVVVKPF
ncbi:MAG: protoporphyrinogen oxidase HemJ [Mariprofundaceae bacterium]